MGAVLVLAALLLLAYNNREAGEAEAGAQVMLEEIRQQLPAATARPTESAEPSPVLKSTEEPEHAQEPIPAVSEAPDAPEVQKDCEYIGILSIPELEVELPVMAEWDYALLKLAPCRHMGAARTDDLVIAAHNYQSHFGELHDLKAGAEVRFTEMDGTVNDYILAKEPEKVAADAVETVLGSEHALVLYTCTPGGKARVAAFFDRME